MLILTKIGIYVKLSTNIMECGKRPYQECTTPIRNLNDSNFKPINRKMQNVLEESFLNAYVNDCFISEPVRTATNIVRTIINANYERVDLNKR